MQLNRQVAKKIQREFIYETLLTIANFGVVTADGVQIQNSLL